MEELDYFRIYEFEKKMRDYFPESDMIVDAYENIVFQLQNRERWAYIELYTKDKEYGPSISTDLECDFGHYNFEGICGKDEYPVYEYPLSDENIKKIVDIVRDWVNNKVIHPDFVKE